MNQADDTTLEKIAQFIATLPSDSLLQKAKTQAQKDEWHKSRETQILLAECWKAKWLVKHYYPIEEALERKEISQHKAELINRYVNEYKARWELCQSAEKYVKDFHIILQYMTSYIKYFPKPLVDLWNKFFHKASLSHYPFNSPYDLFTGTLREEVNGSFAVCLEPYYDVPLKKWRLAIRQYSQILEKTTSDGIYPQLSPQEEQRLKKNLVWPKMSFSWLGLMLLASQFNTFNDPLLRKKFIAHSQSLQETLSFAVKVSSRMPSFAWKNGEILRASGKGGIYIQP